MKDFRKIFLDEMSQKGYPFSLIRSGYFGLLSGPTRCPSD